MQQVAEFNCRVWEDSRRHKVFTIPSHGERAARVQAGWLTGACASGCGRAGGHWRACSLVWCVISQEPAKCNRAHT